MAIAVASSGVKAWARTLMMPAWDSKSTVTIRCHSAVSASIEGSSPRVNQKSPGALPWSGPVVDRPEVEPRVDRGDHLLAADVVEEDVGVGGGAAADLGQRPEDAGRGAADLLRAHGEGGRRVVLVGGPGEEIPDAGGEGQEHQRARSSPR